MSILSDESVITDLERATHRARKDVFRGDLTESKLEEEYNCFKAIRHEGQTLINKLRSLPGWINDPDNREYLENQKRNLLGKKIEILIKRDRRRLSQLKTGKRVEENPQVDPQTRSSYRMGYIAYKATKKILLTEQKELGQEPGLGQPQEGTINLPFSGSSNQLS